MIDVAYLPSYVDDVIEVATYASLPVTGESDKIYVVVTDETSDNNTSSYRWTGTSYAMVSNTLTGADVAALYESVIGVNRYTDAEKAKLAGIEIGATADQLASEITVTPQGNLSSTTVQLALEELQSDINALNSALGTMGTIEW